MKLIGSAVAGIAVVLLIAIGLGAGGSDSEPKTGKQAAGSAKPGNTAKSSREAAAADFKKYVQPFLKKYCFECHGEEELNEGVAFHQYKTVESVLKDRKIWEKAFKRLKLGAMPPEDHEPQPSDAERKRIVEWLDSQLFNIDCSQLRDPGRVTIRRLNRVEYDNTIRDLVGVDFQPAADFPSDDVGEGFDNIGDVLTLSPLLFEKYMDAAETIAEAAIIAVPTNGKKVQLSGRQLKTTNGARSGRGGFIGLSSTGSVYGSFKFPLTGEYVLRAEAAADQAGPDPARMEFRLDGKKVKVFDIQGHRKPDTYEIRLEVEKGERRFDAAFINDYYMPKAKNPRDRDRNLSVRFLEIEGPFGVNAENLPEIHRRIVFCRPDDQHSVADCAFRILKRFAGRAFRRPVSDAEVRKYVPLVEQTVKRGETFEQGIQVAVSAVLVSPHFLFRVERDRKPDDPDAAHNIADYELATRLSYFLWSTMPDKKLFALAKKGELHDSKTLEAQVRRMLADSRSRSLVDNFASQWLNLRNLEQIKPDPNRFPEFTDELRGDMMRETELFFETIMLEDRSLLDFLDADFTFVNKRLAAHYGIEGVTSDRFVRVELPKGKRAGVLTHASILTLTSNPTRTSPVKRGKWILENILDTPPPDPPAGVPELEETAKASPGASLRKQLEIHRMDPACASCHDTMDTLGFGFENFDAIGRWRDMDGEHPVDASGELPGGRTFNGPVELVGILKKQKDDFSRSVSKKMLTYALGRGLQYYDKCALDRIVWNLSMNDYRFSTLVLEIVRSEPFQMRRGDGGKE